MTKTRLAQDGQGVAPRLVSAIKKARSIKSGLCHVVSSINQPSLLSVLDFKVSIDHIRIT